MSTWKQQESERKKNKKKKKFDKPVVTHFNIRNYRFFPCTHSSSLEQGYEWYVLVKSFTGHMIIEQNSPRFKSVEEAELYADKNELCNFVLS
jgi:hypothetical protein